MSLAFVSLIALPTAGLAQHGGGGNRGGYHGGYGGYRGGGRYWRGRYWAYGVGPCWNWNPFFGGWADPATDAGS